MVPLKSRLLVISLALVLLLIAGVQAETEQDCIYYFYGQEEGCPDCRNASELLTKLAVKYPELDVQQFDVHTDLEQYNRLQEYFAAYNVPEESRGVPAVFMSGSYFVGYPSLKTLLEGRILDNDNNECPRLEGGGMIGLVGQKFPPNIIDTFTLGTVASAALLDGLTSCLLALMLALLALVLLAAERKKLLRAGLGFVAGVAVLFFLKGFVLPALPLVSFIVTILVGLVSSTGGVIILINFLKSRKTLLFAAEEEAKLAKLVSPWWGFVAGLVASFFTLACFGQKFLILSELVAQNLSKSKALFLLGYYSLVAVVPLFLLLLLAWAVFGKLEGKTAKKGGPDHQAFRLWQRHHLRLFRFIVGVAMLVLGIVLLLLIFF